MHILMVDDDSGMFSVFKEPLTRGGAYTVTYASSSQQALEIVADTRIDLMAVSSSMPRMNGLTLYERVRSLNLKHYIYFILICGQEKPAETVRGFNGGVDDYLVKPLNMHEFTARIELGARIVHLERELDQKFQTIKRNYYQCINMLIGLQQSYHRQLGEHSRRVGKMALTLARRHPDLPPEDYPVIEAAAMLHDIGLMGLPDELLTKRRVEMTGDEFDLYRSHPARGESILNQVDLLRPVARVVRLHHEQPNGRGFPDGLAGDQIPLTSQIISAASLYDDLVRLLKTPLEKIPEHLQQFRNYQLHTDMVDMLLEINLEQIQREAQCHDREIALPDLLDGMVLARDVRMKTGAFVMAAETCLDANAIEKLKRYFELGNISGKVFIRK
jgi:cyclic di-GMP phosphodiesterase